MIFRARNVVFLLLVAAFASAEETSKALEPAPEKKIDGLQPTPTPASNVTTAAPVKPSTTTSSPNATTPTQAPTSTTTTAIPSTTTTSTTTKPTSTSTTAKPSPTTPSTTPQPTPTTAKPTPPTPKPTPPKNDSWIVSGVNGTVCITANMVIKISVPYKSIENKTVESTFMVEHVENATATGTCAATDNAETLVLTWSNVTSSFNFALNVSDYTYSLSSVKVAIAVNNVTFPNNTMTNVTEVQLIYEGKLFSVPQNNSYTCANVAPLSLKGATFPLSTFNITGTLTVAHVHVQAFGIEKTGKYRAPLDCASTETPDIVPIAVGLILAGLVVVVLVAYLVGRRRAQARGYLSM